MRSLNEEALIILSIFPWIEKVNAAVRQPTFEINDDVNLPHYQLLTPGGNYKLQFPIQEFQHFADTLPLGQLQQFRGDNCEKLICGKLNPTWASTFCVLCLFYNVKSKLSTHILVGVTHSEERTQDC